MEEHDAIDQLLKRPEVSRAMRAPDGALPGTAVLADLRRARRDAKRQIDNAKRDGGNANPSWPNVGTWLKAALAADMEPELRAAVEKTIEELDRAKEAAKP